MIAFTTAVEGKFVVIFKKQIITSAWRNNFSTALHSRFIHSGSLSTQLATFRHVKPEINLFWNL